MKKGNKRNIKGKKGGQSSKKKSLYKKRFFVRKGKPEGIGAPQDIIL